MPEYVVDGFEVVDVDDGNRVKASRHERIKARVERTPVSQPGQLIPFTQLLERARLVSRLVTLMLDRNEAVGHAERSGDDFEQQGEILRPGFVECPDLRQQRDRGELDDDYRTERRKTENEIGRHTASALPGAPEDTEIRGQYRQIGAKIGMIDPLAEPFGIKCSRQPACKR